jgi:hypothetical protein
VTPAISGLVSLHTAAPFDSSNHHKAKSELIINWYSEKIADELKYTESTSEILKVAEEKIKYYKTQANGK